MGTYSYIINEWTWILSQRDAGYDILCLEMAGDPSLLETETPVIQGDQLNDPWAGEEGTSTNAGSPTYSDFFKEVAQMQEDAGDNLSDYYPIQEVIRVGDPTP